MEQKIITNKPIRKTCIKINRKKESQKERRRVEKTEKVYMTTLHIRLLRSGT
jgi:hypothetical protein